MFSVVSYIYGSQQSDHGLQSSFKRFIYNNYCRIQPYEVFKTFLVQGLLVLFFNPYLHFNSNIYIALFNLVLGHYTDVKNRFGVKSLKVFLR